MSSRYRLIKRALDIAISLLALLILLPAFPLIALAIAIDSPGPVVFTQTRVGQGHKLFTLYKLRTMYTDAERLASRLPPGRFIQREGDPRVTRMGRWLRRWSLDEWPQFWNVLRGDMSVVGPRPFILPESHALPAQFLCRLDVLPGITGYAQTHGRNSLTLHERMLLDEYYVRHAALAFDARIMWQTVIVVFRRDGVC